MNLRIVLAAEDKKGPVAKGATYLHRVMQLTGGHNMATCRCYQMLTLENFPATLPEHFLEVAHSAKAWCKLFPAEVRRAFRRNTQYQ